MATWYALLAKSARVSELSERDVLAALLSRDECAAVLLRITSGERLPARAAARALLTLLGQLAGPACTWLEGELAVELFDEGAATRVRVMSEIGAGLRERVLPVVTVAQSLDQLVDALEKRGELVSALRLQRVSSRCALLLAEGEERAPTSTQFDISETSLAWAGSTGADDVDSRWDDAQTT